MTIRVRYRGEVAISSSNQEERDLGNQKYEILDDIQEEGGAWKTNLAAAAVDVPLHLGNVAVARFISLRTTSKDPTQLPSTVRVKLGSTGAESIGIQPIGRQGVLTLSCENVTAIYASNPGAVDMCIVVSAAGD